MNQESAYILFGLGFFDGSSYSKKKLSVGLTLFGQPGSIRR